MNFFSFAYKYLGYYEPILSGFEDYRPVSGLIDLMRWDEMSRERERERDCRASGMLNSWPLSHRPRLQMCSALISFDTLKQIQVNLHVNCFLWHSRVLLAGRAGGKVQDPCRTKHILLPETESSWQCNSRDLTVLLFRETLELTRPDSLVVHLITGFIQEYQFC